MNPRFRIATLAWLLLAAPSGAQGSITNGDVVFVRGSSPWDSSPNANLTGVSFPASEDHLFEVGWAFRVFGDTQETFFPAPTTQVYSFNASTVTWASIRGLFHAQETTTVADLGAGGHPEDGGMVVMQLTLTNLTAAPFLLTLFHLADFDIQPTAGNDTASRPELRTIEVTDADGSYAHYRAPGADAFLVRPFGATDVGNELADAAVDDFADGGLPFGPGDFTGGWEFQSRVLPPGTPVVFTVRLSVNTPLACGAPGGRVFCDGFESGDTSAW